jgi:hypothetical protein
VELDPVVDAVEPADEGAGDENPGHWPETCTPGVSNRDTRGGEQMQSAPRDARWYGGRFGGCSIVAPHACWLGVQLQCVG